MNLRVKALHRCFQLGCLLALAGGTPAIADPIRHQPGDYPFFSAAYTILPSADLESAGAESEVQTKEIRLALGFLQFELEWDGSSISVSTISTRAMPTKISTGAIAIYIGCSFPWVSAAVPPPGGCRVL